MSEATIVTKYVTTAPVDLVGLAEELGLSVIFSTSLPGTIAGKLERDERAGAGYRATINANDLPRRQRFTLAHEIGHYVLHRDLIEDGIVDDALYRSATLSDVYERQADRFAAQILLPAQLVKTAFRRVGGALAPLAKEFDVSDAALRIRLKELGLGA